MCWSSTSTTWCLLRRPDNPPAFTEAELAKLQIAHLAYLDRLGEEGLLALNGPLSTSPTRRCAGSPSTAHEPPRKPSSSPSRTRWSGLVVCGVS